MIDRLCASCRRCGVQGHFQHHIELSGPEMGCHIVGICKDCADPARFSIDQLADAIIAEFARQLTRKTAL